ncbi:hypothetical protein [Mesorhizobium australafricanum]|uniref:Uncharacterized protein n=1 Tax=Mesorhizobium australafricanum TaxID=3072311 RepID=A0ABU4X1N4_9HYPH|nr:hypothetical protein [Mesorhizobium sp. VK3E]MDX8442232.1 hypothetical protein [Mesorhizobium sp. VK3E]
MAKQTQSTKANTEPRKGMPSPRLGESEFKRRYELNADKDIQAEVTNAALALAEAVEKRRAGAFPAVGAGREDPRPN